MALGWRGQYNRYKDFFLNVANFYKQRTDLRIFLEIILSLSTVIIFLVFALKPTALTIISLLQEIKGKEETIVVLDKKLSDLNRASDVFADNQAAVVDIETAVATSPHPDLIIQQVQGLAVKNSVDILGASIGQVIIIGTAPAKKSSSDVKPLPGGAKEMPISINIRGNYPNLITFLKDFENLRIVTKIDNIAITSSTTDSGQTIIAIISGRVPYLGQ